MFRIYVFCKSSTVISDKVVEEFVTEGAYFDNDPVFLRPFEDSEVDKAFKTLSIDYAPGRSPIVISCNKPIIAEKKRTELQDLLILQILYGRSGNHEKMHEWVTQSNSIFAFEFANEELDDENDDAWEMLDTVEAFLARECEGIVYADADRSFYNEKLKKIYEF